MISFQINAEALPPWKPFPYLGRTIAYNNIYWAEVYHKLKKAQRRWGMIARVLEKTGETVQDRGMMYKSVDQLALLYGSKSWVVVWAMINVLEGFHHRVNRCIMGMKATSAA